MITLRSGTQTARKDRFCLACGTTIRKGEAYFRAVTADGRDLLDWWACLPCHEVTVDVWTWADHWDQGVSADDFYEWARADPDSPGQAAFLARSGAQ